MRRAKAGPAAVAAVVAAAVARRTAAAGRARAGQGLTLLTRTGAAAALSGKAATEPRQNTLHLKNVLFVLVFIPSCFIVSILSKLKSKIDLPWF